MSGELAAMVRSGARCAPEVSRSPLPVAPAERRMGVTEYAAAYDAMRDFTARRTGDTLDELWLLEHPPVYTLGQAGRPEHLLRDNGILQIQKKGPWLY